MARAFPSLVPSDRKAVTGVRDRTKQTVAVHGHCPSDTRPTTTVVCISYSNLWESFKVFTK